MVVLRLLSDGVHFFRTEIWLCLIYLVRDLLSRCRAGGLDRVFYPRLGGLLFDGMELMDTGGGGVG